MLMLSKKRPLAKQPQRHFSAQQAVPSFPKMEEKMTFA
jgi:hypothetical protein